MFSGPIKKYLSSLGLALIVMAIPLGMYAKVFYGMMTLNRIIIAIGVILLFPYVTLPKKISKMPKVFNGILLFTILSIIYYFLSSFSDSIHIVYNTLVLIVCISLGCSRYNEDIDLHKTIKWIWLFSALTAYLTYYSINIGLFGYNADPNNARNENGELIFDLLTAAGCCITNLCSSIYLLNISKNKYFRIFLLLLCTFDIYVMLISNKRTPFLVCLFIVTYSLYYYDFFRKLPYRKHYLIVGIILAISLVALLQSNGSDNIINDLLTRTESGIHNMIYGTHSLDETNSTSVRYYARLRASEEISNFSLDEYILGAGYMYDWIDIPLLQAYMDMGILGFYLFFYYVVFFPFKILIKCRRLSPIALWAATNTCYGMICCLNSGHPYGHAKWIPVCILAFVISDELNKIKNKNYNNDV